MIIGTCSICGGHVAVPDAWHGGLPPVPTCQTCGAVSAQHGPIIPMRPSQTRIDWTTTSTSMEIEK